MLESELEDFSVAEPCWPPYFGQRTVALRGGYGIAATLTYRGRHVGRVRGGGEEETMGKSEVVGEGREEDSTEKEKRKRAAI